MIEKLKEWASGKKTYTVSGVLVLAAVANFMGWMQVPDEAYAALVAAGLAALRLGVDKKNKESA